MSFINGCCIVKVPKFFEQCHVDTHCSYISMYSDEHVLNCNSSPYWKIQMLPQPLFLYLGKTNIHILHHTYLNIYINVTSPHTDALKY